MSGDMKFLMVIVGLVALFIGYKIWKDKKARITWQSWPTATQYIESYQKTGIDTTPHNGIKCCNCGSREIWRYGQNFGLFGAGNYHQCHQCSTWLYRSE